MSEQERSDLEFALASVGAFRAAIEHIFEKAQPLESIEDGTIVTYWLPTGPLHKAIGMARGTDAGGKFLAELAAAVAQVEQLRAALTQVIGVLGPTPCRCEGQQEEVAQALKIARAALAGQPAGGGGE